MASTTRCTMPDRYGETHRVTCTRVSELLAKSNKDCWGTAGHTMDKMYDRFRLAIKNGTLASYPHVQGFRNRLESLDDPFRGDPVVLSSKALRANNALILIELVRSFSAADQTVDASLLLPSCKSLTSFLEHDSQTSGEALPSSEIDRLNSISTASAEDWHNISRLPELFTEALDDIKKALDRKWHSDTENEPDMPEQAKNFV